MPQEEAVLCPGLVVGVQLLPPHQIVRTFVGVNALLAQPTGEVLSEREREGEASEEA